MGEAYHYLLHERSECHCWLWKILREPAHPAPVFARLSQSDSARFLARFVSSGRALGARVGTGIQTRATTKRRARIRSIRTAAARREGARPSRRNAAWEAGCR